MHLSFLFFSYSFYRILSTMVGMGGEVTFTIKAKNTKKNRFAAVWDIPNKLILYYILLRQFNTAITSPLAEC
jgi:hypothetical protein